MRLNVVYSTDQAYCQHLGVSIVSLLENNNAAYEEIHIYVIHNKVSADNINKLKQICRLYNRQLTLVDFENLHQKLKLQQGLMFSISAYARLFIADVVPLDVDKVLYLDCDTIIHQPLYELWDTNIEDYCIAGVLDTIGPLTKKRINMDDEAMYVNSGMLLINVKKWRELNIESKFLAFIEMYNGNVFHHDQGTINGVLHQSCLELPPKYNAMSVIYTMKRANILEYYQMRGYYSEEELMEARHRPIIIHFTPGFVNRPWVKGCKHPLADLYIYYLKLTPWRDARMQHDHRAIGEKLVSFLFNRLPFRMANRIRNLVFR